MQRYPRVRMRLIPQPITANLGVARFGISTTPILEMLNPVASRHRSASIAPNDAFADVEHMVPGGGSWNLRGADTTHMSPSTAATSGAYLSVICEKAALFAFVISGNLLLQDSGPFCISLGTLTSLQLHEFFLNFFNFVK